MQKWHGYMVVENLNLSDANFTKLLMEFDKYGVSEQDRQMAKRLHKRESIDIPVTKVIFIAEFDQANLTPQKFKNQLAKIFDVNVETISHNAITIVYDNPDFPTDIVTFIRNGNQFRIGLFGGLTTTFDESNIEILDWLSENQNDWDTNE